MVGWDFYIYTRAITAFADPYSVAHFIYPPAALFLIAPFAVLPYSLGFFVWNLVQLLAFIVGLWLIAPHPRAIITSAIIASPAIGVLLYAGQFDALLVFALGLGVSGITSRNALRVGLALALFTLKPVHVIIPSIALLALLPTWRMRIAASALPMIVLITSLAIWPAWPLEWFQATQQAIRTDAIPTHFGLIPWHITPLVRGLIICAGCAFLIASRRHPIAIVTTTMLVNLVAVPYLNPYSFVLAAPIVAAATYHRMALVQTNSSHTMDQKS